jgi:hypothetical protein
MIASGLTRRDEVLAVMKTLATDGMTMVVVIYEMGFARESPTTLSEDNAARPDWARRALCLP